MGIVQIFIGLVLILIFVGLSYRHKNKKLHARIMSVCLVLDLSVVLYLELSRGAVMEAYEHAPEFLMAIHLVFAVMTLVCYGLAVYTGRRLLRNDISIRSLHKKNAALFLIGRIGVFVTSFWIPV